MILLISSLTKQQPSAVSSQLHTHMNSRRPTTSTARNLLSTWGI